MLQKSPVQELLTVTISGGIRLPFQPCVRTKYQQQSLPRCKSLHFLVLYGCPTSSTAYAEYPGVFAFTCAASALDSTLHTHDSTALAKVCLQLQLADSNLEGQLKYTGPAGNMALQNSASNFAPVIGRPCLETRCALSRACMTPACTVTILIPLCVEMRMAVDIPADSPAPKGYSH